MSMYAFKEETITALGDAVRSKVGETRDKYVNNITYENVDMANYPSEEFAITNGNYTYTTEQLLLPTFLTGYYLITCEELDTQGNSYITMIINGASGESWDVKRVGMVNAIDEPYRINTSSLSSGQHKVSLVFGVATADYENGITPKAARITITPYNDDGSIVEWVIPEKNTMTVAQMAEQIEALPQGPTADDLKLTDDCSYRFANNGWNWLIDKYGDMITTSDITNANNMFQNSSYLTEIPFEINFVSNGNKTIYIQYLFDSCQRLRKAPALVREPQSSSNHSMNNMYTSCYLLEEAGKISGFYPSEMATFFKNCRMLRELPVFENMNYDRIHSYQYASLSGMFSGCYSLRSIPKDFLKELYNPATSTYSSLTDEGFSNCYVLDEIDGLRGPTGTCSNNMFSTTFMNCNRLKRVVFDTQADGTPYAHNWKNQTIDLSACVGCIDNKSITDTIFDWTTRDGATHMAQYNSGITLDKRVYNDETYQALKDDPDWYTCVYEYSRYNKVSAIETINSLPDCTSSGGTNTIKFKGEAGSLTDGSAINTMTDEQIAVAAAKGWTVTFV